MNTRVQVEHCVTEAVDRHRHRARADPRRRRASRCRSRQDEVVLRGHAIECRINAEDAARGLRPRPGDDRPATASRAGPGVRVDSGVEAGSEITPLYDPMVAKLIVWDADRAAATRRMARALRRVRDRGRRRRCCPSTSRSWPRPSGRAARRAATSSRTASGSRALAVAAPPDRPRTSGGRAAGAHATRWRCRASGSTSRCWASRGAGSANGRAPAGGAAGAERRPRRGGTGGAARATRSPPRSRATSSRCSSRRAPTVEEGALVCIIEAMKMENEITAHKAGAVAALPICEGAAVSAGDTLAVIASPG